MKVDFANARNVFPYVQCIHNGALNPMIEYLSAIMVTIGIYCDGCQKSCRIDIHSGYILQDHSVHMAQVEKRHGALYVKLLGSNDNCSFYDVVYSTHILPKLQKWS